MTGARVPRTCTPVSGQGRPDRREAGAPARAGESRPLSAYWDDSAYVLLGDPGAGKSTAFRCEYEALGGERAHLIAARDFLTFAPTARPEWRGKTLFIDGLDEVRAGSPDARTPFDAIRARLDALGRPRFRLSCRAADWLGANDRRHLESVSPDDRVPVLGLDPLTSDDALRILGGGDGPSDPATFIESARDRGLDAMLANPQSLVMLADAVGAGGEWPTSRTETFERACRWMAEETNEEHANAFDDCHVPPDALVNAAGRLCAGLLLADCDGYALRRPASDARYPLLDCCVAEPEGSAESAYSAARTETGGASRLFRRALATRLFTSPVDGRFSPVHRHVAEFLGARHVARLIEAGPPGRRLSGRRVLALIAGGDGTVVTALRGFSGWLAALCRCSGVRRELIDRDPVGVALYGDAAGFSPDDKRRLLRAVHRDAPRLVEFPSPSGSRAFVTSELETALRDILADPDRGREQQSFVVFVLRAAAAPLPGVSDLLLEVVRDDSRYPDVRATALQAFIRTVPGGRDREGSLVVLLDEVHRGIVPDPDGELRQTLLSHLFPHSVPASRVLDYLTEEGDRKRFWYSLPERATDADVIVLLDSLADRQDAREPATTSGDEPRGAVVDTADRQDAREPAAIPDDEVLGAIGDLRGTREPAATGLDPPGLDPYRTGLNAMDLLARGLEVHGDALDVRHLYDWLGVGVASLPYAESLAVLNVDTGEGAGGSVPRVRAWLIARPETQKAIVLEGLRRWAPSKGFRAVGRGLAERFYGADPPADFGHWCLDEALRAAAAESAECAEYLLGRAVRALGDGIGDAGLSLTLLQERTRGHWMEQRLQSMLSSPVDSARGEHRRAWIARDESRRQRLVQDIRLQEAALRENRCPPGLLRPLAAAWFGLLPEVTGDDARTRLRNLLAPDTGLVDAALAGLRGAPTRADVPAAEDVIRRHAAGEEYHLALPVLVGLAAIDAERPDESLALDERRMRSALAFCYTTPVSGVDEWYRRMVRSCPEVVGDVLRRCAAAELRRGTASVPALYALAHDDDHGPVAARATLPLLRSFPTRCRNAQVDALTTLLWAALRWADLSELRRLIERKLGAGSMNDAQRTQWLAAGLVTSPERWRGPVEEFVRGRDARVRRLAVFFVTGRGPGLTHDMRAPELALLIRLLGPVFGPRLPRGTAGGSLDLEVSLAIGELMDRLAASPARAAGEALADLSSDRGLSAWRDALVRARDAQRVVRRDATFRPPSIEEVRRTLANGPPANAGDLAALLLDRLRDIAEEVRTGNANGWRLCWNEGRHRRPHEPKHENSCRDALLLVLRERLAGAADAQPEGHYANDRRADVRVACGSFHVPIEIKKDSHPDLWSALHDQLIARYTQDPATDGYGIYVVLWFGAGGPPPPGRPAAPQRRRTRNASDRVAARGGGAPGLRLRDRRQPAARRGYNRR